MKKTDIRFSIYAFIIAFSLSFFLSSCNSDPSKKVKSENAENLINNEIKIKELELKYNAQLDSQQIKADADLNKMLVAESTSDFRKASEQSQQVQDQIRELYGQGSRGQTPKGSEPGEQS